MKLMFNYALSKEMEMFITLFRDYANLVILEYTPLIEYYCVEKKDASHAITLCARYAFL